MSKLNVLEIPMYKSSDNSNTSQILRHFNSNMLEIPMSAFQYGRILMCWKFPYVSSPIITIHQKFQYKSVFQYVRMSLKFQDMRVLICWNLDVLEILMLEFRKFQYARIPIHQKISICQNSGNFDILKISVSDFQKV